MEQDTTRSSVRKPLDILVEGRLRARPICVELIDVSEGGCKIKGRHGFAEKGEHVTLTVNGIRAPLGNIVWVEGKYAGVSFSGTMHPAIIDHLCKKQLEKKRDSAS